MGKTKLICYVTEPTDKKDILFKIQGGKSFRVKFDFIVRNGKT